jgi:hypothetical protein
MFSNDFTPKNPLNFCCQICDFLTCNKKDFNRHIKTKKHIFNLFQSKSIENTKKTQKNPYECICGKEYKDNSGLWRHKKKCTFEEKNVHEIEDNSQSNEIQELKEFMKYLMKENSEMKNMMMEVIKTGTHNTTNNNHTNSHNKTFNLQFFLNETCKDAMNIMDFVETVKLQLSDLENVGKLGYVDGISNIIVKNLKALDVEKRPVHCTDSKREILYIKDDDKWEKEDEENKKIRKVIKKVADKNARLIPKFKEEHPDCVKSVSRFSDQYNKIIVESFDNDSEKENKIIKNLAKQVLIDKEKYGNID